MTTPLSLPIDSIIPQIQAALHQSNTIILQASPGAGKTTRVPPALLDVTDKQILVLEPRRLAAKLSAERIADERNEKVGGTIGYQIRFDTVASAQTRLKFITEGLLIRYLMSDPTLAKTGCVVLDEFHERHIHTDIALAILCHLQKTLRPDLKLVIMSATLDVLKLSTTFPQAKVFESRVPVYPVETRYFPKPDNRTVEDHVVDAIERILSDPQYRGDVLVFLTGAAQIQRVQGQLSSLQSQFAFDALPLFGTLSPKDQQKIFEPSPRRKVILATNIAETSVTINGVTCVVDTGLAKIAGYASWSGLPTLDIRKVSQASCIQRAGRAGRTAPGVVWRLFSEHDFRGLSAFERPEVQRLDLTQSLLELQTIAAQFPENFQFSFDTLPWFEKPDTNSIQSCRQTLLWLGALDASFKVTNMGERMASIPLHPRLSRFVIEAEKRRCVSTAVWCAAVISEGGIRNHSQPASAVALADPLYEVIHFLGSERISHTPVLRRVQQLATHIALSLGFRLQQDFSDVDESAISLSALYAFPDRVAQRRKTRSDKTELTLCLGGGALLSKASVVRDNEFMLAIDGEESVLSRDAAKAVTIHTAWGIESEWLLEDPAGFLKESDDCYWDAQSERVRAVARVWYGSLVVDESVANNVEGKIAEALVTALKSSWPKPFEDAEALDFYDIRRSLLQKSGLGADLPDFNGVDRDRLLLYICENKKSFAEIASRDLIDYMQDLISPSSAAALEREAPARVTLASGRKVVVHYEADKPPWIAAPLQDFFGTLKTPTIASGRLHLVVHLLAPNKRAVQVTTDLEGFWARAYGDVRKELSRRYPRHFWPEDPKSAAPPPPRGRRPTP